MHKQLSVIVSNSQMFSRHATGEIFCYNLLQIALRDTKHWETDTDDLVFYN